MQPIARYLDAAVLKPESTQEEMAAAIQACIDLQAFSVCVRPCDIEPAKQLCEGTSTKVCVVLGFPHGDQLPESKADEARRYVALGVDEVDMVANYGWAKSGGWDQVQADIAGVVAVTKPAGIPLKVIFETAQHDTPTIERLVEVCVEAGADFVKTSTGFNGEGATEAGVKTMVATAAGRIQVKASGGIRNREQAEKFIALGATRLGVGWTSCAGLCGSGEVAEGGGY